MNETTSRLICEEAESAVERTDPTLLKTFRPSIRKSSNTPEFNPVDTDPEVLFASGEPVHSNPRILVPLDVEAVADSFDQKLASISFEDPLLVSMYPRKGTLGPGEDLDIGVKLSIPEISKLAVSNIIQEKMKLEEEEAKTAIESVPAAVVPDPVERRQSIQPEKKDDVPKSAKKKEKGAVNPVAAVSAVTEVEATIIPPEPVVYSIFDKTTSEDTNATDSQATKLKMLKFTIDLTTPKDSPPLQSDDALNLVGSKVRKPKNTSDVIYLRLIAPVVSPDLILLDPLTSVLDFGTTPLHKQEIRQLFKSLDKTGPFKLITELNQIVPPQSKTSVQILFEPHEELTYTSKFDACSLTSQVEVKLVGQGVIPSIRVDPENTDLFLGDVVVGDTTTKVFKVFNTSYFPLSCQVSLCPSTHGTTNFSNSNAFSVSPWHARIEPNQFQEFVIKFYPDRESDVYFDTVTIYPNGSLTRLSFKSTDAAGTHHPYS
ncbi:hypothetical protein BCR33DRAFT_784048 [Rhizoclosmatium globosum]|uniref:Abnormal spindle-like microcephaly-associated protein ASH domain-containing protein n=1 Tax=Rhizoclosmatium globosum TaxID=329046 RepID=A0A1Y2CGG3_9FUNG|nr:hypothetical protein BCR33DRAFT_784048 [Rhizoclosmatium globosum]|eukprot:ORY45924.1 hypothetical protein BCR33DRAFT_784048 [Rhizoclosmatium globosum]